MPKPLLPILTLCLLILTTSSGCQDAKTSDQASVFSQPAEGLFSLSQDEARRLLEQRPDVVVLDVRTPDEFASGHLQKAVHMDYLAADFPDQVKKLDQNKPYLVYCAVGGRSNKAANLMSKTGFREVYNANAGFKDLKAAGLPTE
jgi:phage shock protein E